MPGSARITGRPGATGSPAPIQMDFVGVRMTSRTRSGWDSIGTWRCRIIGVAPIRLPRHVELGVDAVVVGGDDVPARLVRHATPERR